MTTLATPASAVVDRPLSTGTWSAKGRVALRCTSELALLAALYAGYVMARNALLVATSLGLVGYWLLPTAPPRLLDAGFTDVMAHFSNLGWWGDAASAPRGMEG
jgi:hypothetical protein